MATKTKRKPPVHSPKCPPFWAVKYLVAMDNGKSAEAREAQEKLRALGYVIEPASGGLPS